MAATLAAGWALSGADHVVCGKDAIKFVVIRILTAVVFTVTVASLLQIGFDWLKPRYTLVPIAFMIGLVKDYAELKERALALFDLFRNRKDK